MKRTALLIMVLLAATGLFGQNSDYTVTDGVVVRPKSQTALDGLGPNIKVRGFIGFNDDLGIPQYFDGTQYRNFDGGAQDGNDFVSNVTLGGTVLTFEIPNQPDPTVDLSNLYTFGTGLTESGGTVTVNNTELAPAWANITGIPADIADGDDDTIADGSETIIQAVSPIVVSGSGTGGSPYQFFFDDLDYLKQGTNTLTQDLVLNKPTGGEMFIRDNQSGIEYGSSLSISAYAPSDGLSEDGYVSLLSEENGKSSSVNVFPNQIAFGTKGTIRYELQDTGGNPVRVLTIDSLYNNSSDVPTKADVDAAIAAAGDNLGNHTATQDIDFAGQQAININNLGFNGRTIAPTVRNLLYRSDLDKFQYANNAGAAINISSESWVASTYLPLSGGIMSGDIDFESNGSLLDAVSITASSGNITALTAGTGVFSSNVTIDGGNLQVNDYPLVFGLSLQETDVEPTLSEGGVYADDSENRPKYHDGTSWKAFLLEGDVTGGSTPTISQVLTQGNDAGGLGINNLGVVNVTDLSASNSISGDGSAITSISSTNVNIQDGGGYYSSTGLEGALQEQGPRLLPSGGTVGQVLEKIDGTDYNVQWANPSVGTDDQTLSLGGVGNKDLTIENSNTVDLTGVDGISPYNVEGTISGRTGTNVDAIMLQTQSQFDTDGAPTTGNAVIITDAPAIEAAGGTNIDFVDADNVASPYLYFDNTTPDNTSFTLTDMKEGYVVEIYLNQATEPSFTPTVTIKPDTLDWTADNLANTDVTLTIKRNGKGTYEGVYTKGH